MSKLRETKRSLFHWVKKGVSTEREIITFCHEIIIIMDSWDNETSDRFSLHFSMKKQPWIDINWRKKCLAAALRSDSPSRKKYLLQQQELVQKLYLESCPQLTEMEGLYNDFTQFLISHKYLSLKYNWIFKNIDKIKMFIFE